MASPLGSEDALQIGSILEHTRKRQGIELEAVEERTKIRRKYLRALEDEDWDALPDPTYARGFLRAYAELLGLDSEVLVDAYRRRHEEPSTTTYELAEPLLTGRSRTNGPKAPVPRIAVVGALVTGVVLVLLVLGLTRGGEEPEGAGEGTQRQQRGEDRAKGGAANSERSSGRSGPVSVKLIARSDLQACLVDDDGRVLVPDQLLTAGTVDGPYTAKRFKLELDPGEARIVVNGERAPIAPSEEATAYRVTSGGVRAATFTGALCP